MSDSVGTVVAALEQELLTLTSLNEALPVSYTHLTLPTKVEV